MFVRGRRYMSMLGTRPALRTFTYGLSWVTTIGLFIVNLAGFIDTETGSAFGCGRQWPLCNGNVIPRTWGVQTLIEFSHRGLVGVVTVLLLGLAVLSWVCFRAWLEVRWLVILSVAFVFLEAFLGAMGVLFADPPAVLSIHFGVALIALGAAFLLTVVIGQILRQVEPNRSLRVQTSDVWFANLSKIAFVLLYIAMYVGAYVSSSGDGAAFRGWPIPTESYAVAGSAFYIDILHRSLAACLIALLVYMTIRVHRLRKDRPDLYRGMIVTLVFALLQGMTGGLLIATHLRISVFLLHVSTVSLLFCGLSYVVLQTLPVPKRARQSGHISDATLPAKSPLGKNVAKRTR